MSNGRPSTDRIADRRGLGHDLRRATSSPPPGRARHPEHGSRRLQATGTPGGEARTEWFAAAFEGLCGRWLDEHGSLPVLACGMVGSSRAGWRRRTARSRSTSSRSATSRWRPAAGARSTVLGIVKRHGLAGVIRGEETQVAAVLGSADGADLVLPGTHSKWVRTHGSVVTDFTTFMTGEVYGLLVGGSVLGALAERPAGTRWRAFDRGVRVAGGPVRWAGLLSTAFSARPPSRSPAPLDLAHVPRSLPLPLHGRKRAGGGAHGVAGAAGGVHAAVRRGRVPRERYCRAARLLGFGHRDRVLSAPPPGRGGHRSPPGSPPRLSLHPPHDSGRAGRDPRPLRVDRDPPRVRPEEVCAVGYTVYGAGFRSIECR